MVRIRDDSVSDGGALFADLESTVALTVQLASSGRYCEGFRRSAQRRGRFMIVLCKLEPKLASLL